MFLVLLYSLRNLDITKYFNCEPRYSRFFLRDNLHRIKDVAYVINFNDKQSKGTDWVSLFFVKTTSVYFIRKGKK